MVWSSRKLWVKQPLLVQRVVPLRNMGAAISPFNSFLILQGIESLPVRMDRHCENAKKVAEFLEQS